MEHAYGVTTRSGTAFTDFLDDLNRCTSRNWTFTSGGFAGHCDWRLPNLEELRAIAGPCSMGICVVDPLLLPMRAGRYWSNSTRSNNLAGAFWVDFSNNTLAGDTKTFTYFARAVRTRTIADVP